MTLTEYRPSITEVLNTCGGDIDGYHEGWVPCLCPFHGDEHKSASVNEDEGLFNCHGCGVKGDATGVLMQAYNYTPEQAREAIEGMHVTRKPVKVTPSRKPHGTRKGRDVMLAAMQQYEGTLDQAADYLKGRGITRAAAQGARLGYVADPLPGHEAYRGRLSIPYVTTSGVVDMKFRCVQPHSCKDHGHSKYLCLPGSETRMYHVTSVLTTRPFIAVTEGELDCVVLNHLCDVPAVGIPGANNWQSHYARVLEGFDRIYVLGDGDKAGQEFTKNVSKKLEFALPIVLPEGQDVNDVYVRGGAAAVMNLLGV